MFGGDADQLFDGDTDPGGSLGGQRAAGRRAAGRQAESPRPYEPPSYHPPSYEASTFEPEPHEQPPAARSGRRAGGGPGQPARGPSVTGPQGPGRAVKVRQGKTTDLLFNPAAEDYGQPLYPSGDDLGLRPPDRRQQDGFTSQRRSMDTAEYAEPLYPGPGSADTDARGRAIPRERRPARNRRGSRAAPALPAPDRADRTGPQRRIDDLSVADPRTTGPQRRIDDLSVADPRTTGPQRRVDGPARVDPLASPRRGERTGPQGRVDALSRPDPLTDSGVGVLWAGEPAAPPAGVAPEAAITKSPARGSGTGPFDRPALDVGGPVAEPSRKPRQGAKKTGAAKAKPVRSRPRSGRRKKAVALLGGLVIIAGLAAVGYFTLMPRSSHTVTAPAALGGFVKQKASSTAMSLRSRIMTAAAGDVKNVVAAGYEQKQGPGTSKGPQIVVFIGGNLTGNASASDLISAYMARLHGSFPTSPGRLGGQAACAPGTGGGPSECAWADGDTFGVVVSATLSAKGLADEMRQMRSLVELVAR
jgi:hypothetical protein